MPLPSPSPVPPWAGVVAAIDQLRVFAFLTVACLLTGLVAPDASGIQRLGAFVVTALVLALLVKANALIDSRQK